MNRFAIACLVMLVTVSAFADISSITQKCSELPRRTRSARLVRSTRHARSWSETKRLPARKRIGQRFQRDLAKRSTSKPTVARAKISDGEPFDSSLHPIIKHRPLRLGSSGVLFGD